MIVVEGVVEDGLTEDDRIDGLVSRFQEDVESDVENEGGGGRVNWKVFLKQTGVGIEI